MKIIISVNPDEDDVFDVETVIDTYKVDVQTVETAKELKDNAYVIFKKDAALTETASTPLTGGTNAASVTGKEYQSYLDKIESYSFNTMGCPTTDDVIIDLFVQFTKRMRDEVGVKFQTVVYKTPADYEGTFVENKVLDEGVPESSVYWVTGAEVGCPVNKLD